MSASAIRRGIQAQTTIDSSSKLSISHPKTSSWIEQACRALADRYRRDSEAQAGNSVHDVALKSQQTFLQLADRITAVVKETEDAVEFWSTQNAEAALLRVEESPAARLAGFLHEALRACQKPPSETSHQYSNGPITPPCFICDSSIAWSRARISSPPSWSTRSLCAVIATCCCGV